MAEEETVRAPANEPLLSETTEPVKVPVPEKEELVMAAPETVMLVRVLMRLRRTTESFNLLIWVSMVESVAGGAAPVTLLTMTVCPLFL